MRFMECLCSVQSMMSAFLVERSAFDMRRRSFDQSLVVVVKKFVEGFWVLLPPFGHNMTKIAPVSVNADRNRMSRFLTKQGNDCCGYRFVVQKVYFRFIVG
jgi:hypothetical protein